MPKAEVTLQKAAAPSRSAASIKALGSENLNRLNFVLVSAGCVHVAQMPAFGPHFHTGNKAQPKERLRVNKLELELATKHRPAPFFSYGSFSILTNLILTHITSNSYPDYASS